MIERFKWFNRESGTERALTFVTRSQAELQNPSPRKKWNVEMRSFPGYRSDIHGKNLSFKFLFTWSMS